MLKNKNIAKLNAWEKTKTMKANIHPTYYTDVQVTCTCGNTFVTGSIKSPIQVEICAACHPFFTGEVKYVDLAGRVDKFLAKQQAAQQTAGKSSKKSAKKVSVEDNRSLKEMLEAAQREAKKSSKSAKLVEATETDTQ